MGAGGIVQQHAKVLLVAVTDPSMYRNLSAIDKASVDLIDAKDPMSRTQAEVNTLYSILGRAKSC